jgi:fucose 4-O-acetylase-like acetyltransferase
MKRIHSIDTAKAFGMFLVYYGHFVERLFSSGTPEAFLHWKLIYSVHVPLFFFLSGIFWKPSNRSFGDTLKIKYQTRLIPLLFFGALAVPFWVVSGESYHRIVDHALKYVAGMPALNGVTWFLVCLFTVEILLSVFSQLFHMSGKPRVVAYSAIFLATGFLMTHYGKLIVDVSGVRMNFWFFHEAFIAASFYIAGYAVKDRLLRPVRYKIEVPLLVLTGACFFLTINLNHGPFLPGKHVVVMSGSAHGNFLLFSLTAYTGIAFVLLLIRVFNIQTRVTDFVGRNTLIYLGVNGLCFHFFDKWVIVRLGFLPDTSIGVFFISALYVICAMLAAAPVAALLKRYLPQLVGVHGSHASIVSPIARWSEVKWLKQVIVFCTGRNFHSSN